MEPRTGPWRLVLASLAMLLLEIGVTAILPLFTKLLTELFVILCAKGGGLYCKLFFYLSKVSLRDLLSILETQILVFSSFHCSSNFILSFPFSITSALFPSPL